ncbi:hypothetical protein M5689_014913 [Euphorbia peplus]|nr:hypothetical protein M5689_014913 [Euphorbia peplus]
MTKAYFNITLLFLVFFIISSCTIFPMSEASRVQLNEAKHCKYNEENCKFSYDLDSDKAHCHNDADCKSLCPPKSIPNCIRGLCFCTTS